MSSVLRPIRSSAETMVEDANASISVLAITTSSPLMSKSSWGRGWVWRGEMRALSMSAQCTKTRGRPLARAKRATRTALGRATSWKCRTASLSSSSVKPDWRYTSRMFSSVQTIRALG